jgi:hypothetical protein
MLSKSDSIAVSTVHLLRMLSDNTLGLTVAGLAAGLLGVFVRRDGKFLVLWMAAVASIIASKALAGSNFRTQYLLPPGLLLYTLGCVAAVSLIERKGISRWIGLCTTTAILVSALVGSFQIVTQAMRVPVKFRVAEAIKKICRPERDRILGATTDLGLPISAEALQHGRARHERIAKKYGVELPASPVERTERGTERTGGYFIQSMPWVVGGLEELKPEQVKIVKPFNWPIQYEEWKLDYWVDQGFNIYVIGDMDSLLHHPVEEYRSFFNEIRQRCDLVDEIPTHRPLFDTVSQGYRIYRLRPEPFP